MKSWNRWAVVVAALFALPAHAEKPQIQWNEQYDFDAVETFQWQFTPETSLEQRNPFMHSLIKNSLEEQLATSGLTEVQSNPDVYVNYHASMDTEVRLQSNSYGYGFGGYGMGGWGTYGYGVAGPVSTTTRAVEYDHGTLVVDIWDAASKELVWRGTVSEVLPDNVQKAEKLVRKAIIKLAAQGRKLWAKQKSGNPASVVARLALDTPYNHSFELVPTGEARGGVLLVHGLTDSPYAMRGMAETLLAQGYYVLALRLPGHGTLPSGLLDVTWQNWFAAVSVAARHVRATIGPDKPLIFGGFSTGAALVTLYSVRSLDDPALPRPQSLYLVSPAIGISRSAALTNFVSALSFLPGFEKSRWIDVVPEYDPYRYNSFPVNAASQIYKLTRALRREIDAAGRRGELAAMPRVFVFQSIIDSTITASEVIQGLLARLPPGGHELVVFDVNRGETMQGFIAPAIVEDLEKLRNATGLPFRMTLIGNLSPDTRQIAAYTREAGQAGVSRQALPLEWPPGVFSVGHSSLPFPPDDPVYGVAPPAETPLGFSFGNIAVRGENGALVVPLGAFARLRSNPFFDVIRDKIVETLPDSAAVTR